SSSGSLEGEPRLLGVREFIEVKFEMSGGGTRRCR
ncbi:unnamed protein product, partial [Rotaria magnacalcarata]